MRKLVISMMWLCSALSAMAANLAMFINENGHEEYIYGRKDGMSLSMVRKPAPAGEEVYGQMNNHHGCVDFKYFNTEKERLDRIIPWHCRRAYTASAQHRLCGCPEESRHSGGAYPPSWRPSRLGRHVGRLDTRSAVV